MLTVVLGTAVFSAAAGLLAYRMGHERARAESRNALEGLAQAVEKTLSIGAYASDRVLIQEVVDGLARHALVASVEVRSMKGEVLAQRARIDAGMSVEQGMSVKRRLVSPFDTVESVGVLHIRADSRRIDAAAVQEAIMLAGLMAGQAALVALLLYCVAAWLVSQPIVRVARQLGELPPGTDKRLAVPSLHRHDEVGVLIRGANALLNANAAVLRRERDLRIEVEAMEAQYRKIFESSSAGIFVLDGHGRLINGNPTVCKVVGLSLAEMRGLEQHDFIKRVFSHPERVRLMMDRAARLGETVSGDLELVRQGAVRRWVHCLISVQGGAQVASHAGGHAGGMVEGVIYDITERKGAEAAARYRSNHDALTGLKNRAASDLALEHQIAQAIASGLPLSVLCIDLDGFKQVNDRFGHHAGDQVLMACAERMQAAVRRSSDLVGRMGGDEFMVALGDVGPADPALCLVATALVEALRMPFTLENGVQVWIGASIGVACLPLHGTDRNSLVLAADAVMYEVKRSGKNSFAMALGPASFDGGVSADKAPVETRRWRTTMPSMF